MPVSDFKLPKGTCLFELNIEGRAIRETPLHLEIIDDTVTKYYRINPRNRYVVALNKKNADRKFYNLLMSKK